MEHNSGIVFLDAINNYSFPFAETVLFLCIASIFKKNENPYKIYIKGLIIGGIIILIVVLRNLLVLGPNINNNMYFPSYITTRIVELGGRITRIEGAVTINFILAGITKVSICLLAAAKGISKIFNIRNHKELVVPSAIIILALCSFLYSNIIEMFSFIEVYTIYAFPFQFIIPIVVWIASEIKAKKKLQNNTL
jgi:spore germination protein KB